MASLGKVSANDVKSSADSGKKKRSALSVYCQHKEGVREEYLHLMNIHQSNGEFGQITIKALQAAAEWRQFTILSIFWRLLIKHY